MIESKDDNKNYDEKIIDFVYALYFGDRSKNVYDIAINKAYLDFCRTIKFNSKKKKDRNNAYQEVRKLLKDWINNMDDKLKDPSWHQNICMEISHNYIGYVSENKKEGLYYGQSQKWFNMFIKYLFVLTKYGKYDGENQKEVYKKIIKYMNKYHAPLDNRILNYIKDNMSDVKSGITTTLPWSKWGQREYYNLYNKLVNSTEVKDKGCLPWELNIFKIDN